MNSLAKETILGMKNHLFCLQKDILNAEEVTIAELEALIKIKNDLLGLISTAAQKAK